MLLVTLTRRWEHFLFQQEIMMLLLEKQPTLRGVSQLCVGTSASSLAMEKNQPYIFHSWRVGAPLRALVAEEHLNKKQCLHKTISHLTETCPGPYVVPKNF